MERRIDWKRYEEVEHETFVITILVMKFGLDKRTNERIEPTKGVNAICQCCGVDLIPKCGRIRDDHWAHKNLSKCDRWWEPETEWHRSWKNEFPLDWQEIIQYDHENDERHIADVFNPSKELVIEFQNSSINIDELQSRERFYKKMIWVVNAKDFNITTFPLDLVKEEIEKLQSKCFGGRINSFFSIPYQIRMKLLKRRDEILGKVRLGERMILSLMDLFDNEISLLVAQHKTGDPKVDGVDPNQFKRELLEPILYEIHKQIKKFSNIGSDRNVAGKYWGYKLTRKQKVWGYPESHLFFDRGGHLYWLKSDCILKEISREEFVEHYNK